MQKAKVIKIFECFKQNNPEPKTELEYTNNFTLLVAVVLSAQSTDKGVNKATPALFAVADTPQKMYALGVDKVKTYIKTIGLFNTKAENIIKLSKQLIDKHNSIVPDDFDSLHALPGVGRKTANVVLNCAFKRPTMAVDTHIFRVSNRIGLVNTKNPDQTEKALLKIIPDKYKLHAHHWLILHGRYTCIARKPKCDICQIKEYCKFYAHKN